MAFADMRASAANDAMRMDGDNVVAKVITTAGLRAASQRMAGDFPRGDQATPSIAQAQRTIDIAKRENAVLEIAGRHDPCIVPRAVVVLESILAIALCELMMDDAAQRALEE